MDAPPSSSVNAVDKPKILQPEIQALSRCLKTAVIETAQIYRSHADAQRLGVQRHVRHPPRARTAALGRSLEKYDQLCDSIDAHLKRAIAVLKRDLQREKERLEAEERQKRLDMAMLPPPTPPQISDVAPDSNAPLSTDGSRTNTRNSPVLSSGPGRRPSAISISSLHRPQFPLKLDLSSTSLRITEEEASLFQKGLASPVTLAPKSARPVEPNEFPADLMAAFANPTSTMDNSHASSDLTLIPDNMDLSQDQTNINSLDVGLGDSLEKPIELDLDGMDIDMTNMTDAFGDPIENGDAAEGNAHDSLFSPIVETEDGEKQVQSESNPDLPKAEENILSTFDINDDTNDNELFGGDFASGAQMADEGNVPSQFDGSSSNGIMDHFPATQTNPSLQEGGEQFDLDSLDLSNLPHDFFSGENSGLDFSSLDFLNMGNDLEQRGENAGNSTAPEPAQN
ncbi:hypothetical protein CPC08DRAFT_739081 [Agrocybe pediades]|nr:hypothetical protein CPC08DRAFT_739081 [Agrocybe pediades]